MEPLGYESGPSRAMSTFKAHEESYHRCSQAINRHINGLQLGTVEAVAAEDLPADLVEAEQHVSFSSSVTEFIKCYDLISWWGNQFVDYGDPSEHCPR